MTEDEDEDLMSSSNHLRLVRMQKVMQTQRPVDTRKSQSTA